MNRFYPVWVGWNIFLLNMKMHKSHTLDIEDKAEI